MKRAAAVTALSAAVLTGVAVVVAGGADAAAPPTTTGEVSFTATTTSALAGDSGATFLVDSYSWGAQIPLSPTGTARPAAQTLTVQRPVGAGSAALLNTMATGRQISRLDLTVRSRAGERAPVTLVAYRLEGCTISDLKQGGEHTGTASEAVSLSCRSSTVTTTPVRPDGSTGPATVGTISRR